MNDDDFGLILIKGVVSTATTTTKQENVYNVTNYL